jgi:hypothetical protein
MSSVPRFPVSLYPATRREELKFRLLFYKPYYLEAGKGGDKAYVLLRDALVESGKIASARVVVRARQHLAAASTLPDDFRGNSALDSGRLVGAPSAASRVPTILICPSVARGTWSSIQAGCRASERLQPRRAPLGCTGVYSRPFLSIELVGGRASHKRPAEKTLGCFCPGLKVFAEIPLWITELPGRVP